MNLATPYLGLTLRSPLIVGASPFCDEVHDALRLQDAGAAALVMRSLFKEQIAPTALARPPSFSTSVGPQAKFPEFADYQLSPEQYLKQLQHLKRTLSIPVIASLNGDRPGAWLDFGKKLQDAGAAAIELNFYQVVTDATLPVADIEGNLCRTVGDLAGSVSIPIAVKLSPFHTSVARLATSLEKEGAAGVVLFNRFYQPDINTEELTVAPHLRLSDPGEFLLRLRWLAILSPQLRGSLAATGGIHTANSVIKALLAGAHAVQVVSILLKQGPTMLSVINRDLQTWMKEHGFADLAAFRGRLNQLHCNDASAFERANYIRAMQSWSI